MTDPLEGRFLDIDFLAKCVGEVRARGEYHPEVLILSEADFNGHLYAIKLHGYSHHIINGYKKLGIKRIVYADDLNDGEFLLSSGKGLPEGILTISFKEAT